MSTSKPVRSTPHLARSSSHGRALKRILIFLGCLLVLGLFWFFSRMGPRDVDYRDLKGKTVEVSEEVKAQEKRSLELEREFEAAIAMREDPLPEDIEVLRQALEAQRRYVDGLPSFNPEARERLGKMEERYQTFAAARILAESVELENLAQELAEQDKIEEARTTYIKAFDLQKRINEEFPRSTAANAGRATRLQRQARYLRAEPLLRQSIELEEAAREKAEAEEWAEAEALLQQSIDIQEAINRDFRGTNQASVARLEDLKITLVTIRSGQDYLAIERLVELAEVRRVEGKNLEAASIYEEARRLQRELNEKFPESPYASSERLLEFQRKSQTAQSVDLGREIERNHTRLDQLLSDRRTYEAAEIIVRLRRDIEQMSETYPRSSFNDEALQIKIRYLNLVQSDLGFIQDRIYDSILPIPEVEGWHMLRTEVPQALYGLIMGTNPSRNQGDVRPVDSVSWIEAKRFCERLSWIMGKPVRLPTEYEFRQAIGRLRYVVLEDHVWAVSETQGEAQEVATKQPFASGFYDLLGNVSEWLESVDSFETEDALHIGGSAQDNLEAIFTVPLRESSRGERNRMIGFRVVVDLR